jgi:hypothetical protein
MGGQFDTVGPIEMPRGIDEEIVAQWFSRVIEKEYPGLGSAVGIYIIARQVGRLPAVPWYVGKTEVGFLRRFKQHAGMKRGFGNLNQIPKGGKLRVFLLPLRSGKKGVFRKAPKTANTIRAVNALEDMLIGSCLSANEHLLNVSQKTLHRDLRVPGYLHDEPSERSAAATELARMLEK